MSITTEHTACSLVFADHDQNYYLIPVEAIERGRVPAARKAEIEQAMREHEVTGYNPLAAVAAGAAVGAAAGVVVGGVFAAGVVTGAAALAVGAAAGYAYSQSGSGATAPAAEDGGKKR
jgi:hypothetical protein